MAERRDILKLVGGALSGALGLALFAPAVRLLVGSARGVQGSRGDAIDLGPLDRFPERAPTRATVMVPRLIDAWTAFQNVTLGAVFLTREGAEVRALSTVCPHTGCAVDWDRAQEKFVCPCHGSTFARDGARLSGPAARGMDPLEAEVVEGRVRVRYQRFRPGVPGREPT